MIRKSKYTYYYLKVFIAIWISLTSSCIAFGQKPPRPITVEKVVDLSFGAFYQGAAGGSVAVNFSGARVAAGDVVLLDMGYTVAAAVFRVTGANGTLITPTFETNIILNGSSGGSMVLNLDGVTNPQSPFILSGVTPVTVNLQVGGILTVGAPASNPPGSYSGSFTIIFNQN